MSRPPDSSKWFLPLVAGTELVRRTPGLQDMGGLTPPMPPVCMPPGLILWLDRRQGVQTTTDARVYRWLDKSPAGNSATQPTVAERPFAMSVGVSFKD